MRAARPMRTVLEKELRERRQTLEEFVRYTEDFARQHCEPGTLSVRHLQRLASGRRGDGSPLGPPRPATARLLERILGRSIEELLSEPLKAGATKASPVPFTVAIAVVIKGDDVLVVRRRGHGQQQDGWQFPAGVVKPGFDADRVAVEEAAAETGIHCEVVDSLGSRVHPTTGVLCEYFQCRYLAGQPVNRDPVENIDAVWIGGRDVAALIPANLIFPPVLDALGLPMAS